MPNWISYSCVEMELITLHRLDFVQSSSASCLNLFNEASRDVFNSLKSFSFPDKFVIRLCISLQSGIDIDGSNEQIDISDCRSLIFRSIFFIKFSSSSNLSFFSFKVGDVSVQTNLHLPSFR